MGGGNSHPGPGAGSSRPGPTSTDMIGSPPTNEGPPQGGDDAWKAYVDQQVASLRSEILLLLDVQKGEAPVVQKAEAPPPELATVAAAEDNDADHRKPATPTHLDEHDHHPLAESMWDCVIFVGLDCLGVCESCFVVFLVALNIAVQVYFCYILFTSSMLADPLSASSLDGLLRFRTGVAHNVEHADLVSRRSLLAQVCAGEDRLHVSAMQRGLYEDLNAFTKGGKGQLLCLLALLCWSGTVLGEVGSTIRFAQAILHLRASRTQVFAKAGGGFVLGSLSSLGVAKVFLLCVVPKLLTAGWLYYIGLLFLANTSRLEDLLLNAMSLGFVLEVDNLFFTAFAPHRVKSLMSGLEQLSVAAPFATHKRLRALGAWPAVLRLLAAIAVILAVFYGLVKPFHGRLDLAKEILCGGHQDFVYAINPATGMVVSARSDSDPDDDMPPAECSVLQLTGLKLEEKNGWSPPGKERCTVRTGQDVAEAKFSNADFDGVRRMANADVRGAGANALCVDEIRGNETPEDYLVALQHAVGMEVKSCKDVQSFCALDNMTTVRALCATTCQCMNLGFSFAGFFKTAERGCPQQCLAEAKPLDTMDASLGIPSSFSCKDKFGFAQLSTRQVLELIDTNGDSMILQHEVDSAYKQGFIDDRFRADLFLFDRSHSPWGGIWNMSELEADFVFVRELYARLDLDRDGSLTSADVFGVGLNASSFDLNDDGFVTMAEAAGHEVVPPVPPLFPVAPFTLEWRAGTELYIRGLFAYIHSRPGFLEIMTYTLSLFGHVINSSVHEQVLHHFEEGAAEDWINGRWMLAPGVPHPRGLTGCAFLTSWEMQMLLSVNLCNPTGVASLRIVCPESCKCQAEMEDCPATCPSVF